MSNLRSLLSQTGTMAGTGLPDGRIWQWQATCWTCNNEGNYQEYCCMAWIVPTGVTSATFEIWGGGGGGAGSCCCSGGPPGGSGAYSKKTIAVSAGACYAMQLGASTYCSASQSTGCRGCVTWVTGTGLSNFCAEGGMPGCSNCWPSCCFAMCTCGTPAAAYGGDIMQCGVRGCFWFICCDNGCYNKVGIAYPAGLVNQCGGVSWIGFRGNNYPDFETCVAGSYIGYAQMKSQYVPGLGGATGYRWGGSCFQGFPGMAGLVRITYK